MINMKVLCVVCFGIALLLICTQVASATAQRDASGFVGNVEGLWYYENSSYPNIWGGMIGDSNGDGVGEVVIARYDQTNSTVFLGALSGSGKISFNSSLQIWGWVTVKNFTGDRDKILLIDDVNNDSIKDICVTNDTVGTSHLNLLIISGKTGTILQSKQLAARNANFYFSIRKTIDVGIPSQDGIGELLLVMNHSIPKSLWGTTYFENYLRIYVINPTTGTPIWGNPIDRGPLNFPMDPTNPYIVTVSEDVSGNNKPDIFIASSGLNMTFFPLTFNNSEISVVDCQDQNTVWERTDLTSGFILDFRVYDFTGDGTNDIALSKVKIGLAGVSVFIADNVTETLYGNNGTIVSRQSHDVSGVFAGFPVNSIYSGFDMGLFSELLTNQSFVDYTGDGAKDLIYTPLDFSAFMNLTPKQTANLTLLDVKENTTVWQNEINQTLTLAFIYPGDVNADGKLDVLLVPNPLSTGTNEITMYSGANGSQLWSIEASYNDSFWTLLVPAVPVFSDLNGDSFPDFVTVKETGISGGSVYAEIRAISGRTGLEIYRTYVIVPSLPYNNTTITLNTLQTGDISGDGKPDFALYAKVDVTATDTNTYGFAVNGTNGETMWYYRVTQSHDDTPQILGTLFIGTISGLPATQCDANGNGLSDDVIVHDSNAIYVVYTILGAPVNELSLWVGSLITGVAITGFATISIGRRTKSDINRNLHI
ncbi:MAG: hypothetical protein ACP5LE_06620 [Thermoplasmata archaeon]